MDHYPRTPEEWEQPDRETEELVGTLYPHGR